MLILIDGLSFEERSFLRTISIIKTLKNKKICVHMYFSNKKDNSVIETIEEQFKTTPKSKIAKSDNSIFFIGVIIPFSYQSGTESRKN